MKDSPYLTHDIGARNDPKLIELAMEMKGQGKAIWWDLVEMLWENDGYLPLNYKALAYGLRYCTPEEVEMVVTRFGLFENDGQRFWSEAALRRIAHKQDTAAKKAAAGRKGGFAKAGNTNHGEVLPADAAGTALAPIAASAGTATALPAPINKLINKSINKSISIPPTAEDKKRIFEIFFFMNFTNPSREVDRFIEYYAARGWQFREGQPMVDLGAAAKSWKPEDESAVKYPADFLQWYQMVFNAADGRLENREIMLTGLVKVTIKGRDLCLVYRKRSTVAAIKAFVTDNHIEADWNIEWFYSSQ